MTTSLELSKQLYEAGLRIETFSTWAGNKLEHNIKVYGGEGYYYPAFSTDELLACLDQISISWCKSFFEFMQEIFENF